MIELATDQTVLRRFASELDASALRPTPERPDLSRHAAIDRDAARFAWASRIVDEYRSVAVFGELLHLLAELEAPYDALCAVQRVIGDELRHTRLCAEVLDWLGGADDFDIDLAGLGLPPRDPDEPIAARALAIIGRELVVAEEESVHVLAAFRDSTTEPAIRAVLGILLVDEARHAAAGRALYRALSAGPIGAAAGPALAALTATMDADRADLRARYAAGAIDGPGRALGAVR